jgi:TolB-like protein/Tfp pilus assembly protein PilF
MRRVALPRTPADLSVPEPDKIMLAILPFENLSRDPNREYLSDGLTEEMIAQLGCLCPDRLGVVARTSIMRYKHTQKGIKEIGAELGVSFLLEGSVREVSGRVRITAQLIKVRDETHLWASVYERDMADVLALQCDVARAIINSMLLKLSSKQETRLSTGSVLKPEAFENYAKGRFHWNKRTPHDVHKAIQHFQQAMAMDPNYAPAYAGLADCYVVLGSVPNDVLPPREAMPKAKHAALRALTLNPDLAEAHISLACVEFSYEWDWTGAERDFRVGLELNPNYATGREWFALYLSATGRMEDALREIKLAARFDPLSPVIHIAAAQICLYTGRYDEALERIRIASELEPNFIFATYFEGRYFELKGMYAEAIEAFQKVKGLTGGIPMTLMALGHAYALAGDKIQAQVELDHLEALSKTRYFSGFYPLAICAALGDTEQAFKWFQQAFEDRSDYLVYFAKEPGFEIIQKDPRFETVMRKIGLPGYRPRPEISNAGPSL